MAVAKASHSPRAGGTFSMRSSHVVLDQVEITFDDPRAVAHAGLLLPATLAERLGIEQATDRLVDLDDRTGAALPTPRRSPTHSRDGASGHAHHHRWQRRRRHSTRSRHLRARHHPTDPPTCKPNRMLLWLVN